MGFTWTDNQLKIIEHTTGNFLVSAGAGSGKTAVLTSHIENRVLDSDAHTDINRMLVLTFTKAAAAEMKNRIRDKLEERLEKEPDNINIRKQIEYLAAAQISTIDSFCQRVLKEQFFAVDLDPGFKVADDTEMKLLKKDILNDIIKRKYDKKDESFLILASKYGRVKGDEGIKQLLEKILSTACSNPDPLCWLEKKRGCSDISWTKEVVLREKKTLKAIYKSCECMKDYAVRDKFPMELIAALDADATGLRILSEKEYESIDIFLENLKGFSFATKPRAPKKNPGDEWLNPNIDWVFKIWRNKPKEKYKKLYSGLLPGELILAEEKSMVKIVDILIELTIELYTEFQAAKKAANQVDFNDMEQLVHKLFVVEGKPSDIAIVYSEQFDEILVDEYQDCNLIQEEILTAISRPDMPDRFMVGDVKQSIYGFRNARPDFFLDKYGKYKRKEVENSSVIELMENFRSKSGVLEGINMFFSRMMTEELGGIEYSRDGYLKPTDFSGNKKSADIEILLADTCEDEEEHFLKGRSYKEKESRMVAAKIRELLDSETEIFDKNLGKNRTVRPGDIAILLRAVSSNADIYIKALKEYGIYAYCESGKAYYEAMQIQNILSILNVIDNPYQDVELAGTMLSALCDFTADDLAGIRIYGKKRFIKWLYDCVRACAKASDDEISAELRDKCKTFIDNIELLRKESRILTLRELITKIINDTGFMYYVQALPGGKKRVANLQMLMVTAAGFEETRYRGIFQFMRYIDQLKKYEMDIDTPALTEDESTVLITTIHKSKGLEFPICFVCGTGGRFSRNDLDSAILEDEDIGIGLDIAYDMGYVLPSFKKNCIRKKKSILQKTEELRLLYVAMTRARDRLIITGHVKKHLDYFEKLGINIDRKESCLSYACMTGGDCYRDWIMSAVLQEYSNGINETEGISFSHYEFDVERYHIKVEAVPYYKIPIPYKAEELPLRAVVSEELDADMIEVLKRSYPYENESRRRVIYTVSELKKRCQENEEESGEYVLARAKKGKLKGKDRGNAYHYFMEALDYTRLSEKTRDEEILGQLEYMKDSQILTSEEADCIELNDIVKFVSSELGKRMRAATISGKLLREQEFVIGENADDIIELSENGDCGGDVLIQGIIDAVFKEDGRWIIVDYKTDFVKKPEELAEKYSIQLKYYCRAWERITGEKVGECYLYSFGLGMAIRVDKL